MTSPAERSYYVLPPKIGVISQCVEIVAAAGAGAVVGTGSDNELNIIWRSHNLVSAISLLIRLLFHSNLEMTYF